MDDILEPGLPWCFSRLFMSFGRQEARGSQPEPLLTVKASVRSASRAIVFSQIQGSGCSHDLFESVRRPMVERCFDGMPCDRSYSCWLSTSGCLLWMMGRHMVHCISKRILRGARAIIGYLCNRILRLHEQALIFPHVLPLLDPSSLGGTCATDYTPH